jgi:hypothetical protein
MVELLWVEPEAMTTLLLTLVLAILYLAQRGRVILGQHEADVKLHVPTRASDLLIRPASEAERDHVSFILACSLHRSLEVVYYVATDSVRLLDLDGVVNEEGVPVDPYRRTCAASECPRTFAPFPSVLKRPNLGLVPLDHFVVAVRKNGGSR